MNRKLKTPIRSRKLLGRGLINNLVNNLPWELHLPGYQYCGPGTKLEQRLQQGDRGINPLDSLCREHDIAYSIYPDLANRHRADRIFLQGVEERIKAPDAKFSERAAARLVKAIISTKLMMGAGMRRKRGAGCKRKKRVKRGGFLFPAMATALQAFKTYKDYSNAKKILAEQQKHNKNMEDIAKGKGLFLKPKGSGFKRRKRRRGS